jgi:hypothetical protein
MALIADGGSTNVRFWQMLSIKWMGGAVDLSLMCASRYFPWCVARCGRQR